MNEELLLEAEARRRGVSVTQLRMQMAVSDALIRDIINDSRRGVTPRSGLIASKPDTAPRGNGWVEPRPLAHPPGVAACDRLVDAQDAADRARVEAVLGLYYESRR